MNLKTKVKLSDILLNNISKLKTFIARKFTHFYVCQKKRRLTDDKAQSLTNS
jgi:hypothetical protein